MRRSAIRFFAAAAVIAACIAFFRDTLAQGQDFLVFYRATRAWLEGMPIYDLTRDGGMIFKYPPWIVPFFFPYSLLNESAAKAAWSITQIISLFYVFYWCKKTLSVRVETLFNAFFLYWGIWVAHFLDGQVTLVFMACTMACFSFSRKSPLYSSFAGILLSTKVYSFLGLIPFFYERDLSQPQKTKDALISLIALCVFALMLMGIVLFQYENPQNFFEKVLILLEQWVHAAASGVNYLGEDKVLGRANQSLTALALRAFWWGFPQNISEMQRAFGFSIDLLFGAVGFLMASIFLVSVRDKISRELFFSIALALVPVIHPLPWIHGFTLAFPLFVFGFEKTQLRRSVYLAIFLLCIASRNTLGQAGEWLELLSVKGFGVLLLIPIAMKAESRLKI